MIVPGDGTPVVTVPGVGASRVIVPGVGAPGVIVPEIGALRTRVLGVGLSGLILLLQNKKKMSSGVSSQPCFPKQESVHTCWG